MKALYGRGLAWFLVGATGTVTALACGPFFTDLLTVKHSAPADPARYARGELGVVKPTFARRYLVQAYRATGGAPPIAPDVRPTAAEPSPDRPPFVRWQELQMRELPPAVAQALKPINPERIAADYSSFSNCLDAAFTRALDAYADRVKRYSARGIETTEWLTAQAAVFQNCAFGPLVLPAPAAPGVDARLQADRDYQTASAYFYATQYDEAAGRFRAIASNASSPWRTSGRYLAARALIRSVTVPSMPPKDAAQRLAAAERDLQATLADRDATALHASARGLQGFIAAHVRPIERLHELSARLASAPTVAPQDLVDYTWLMDLALGETPSGKPPLDLGEVTKGDDLTDWIVATQKRRPRAIERWQETRSERWLVAALWTADGGDTQTPALLAAAAQVPQTSPAFATTTVLRARLMIERNDLAAARTMLAALPSEPRAGFDAETINLLRAARVSVAASLDDLLAAAPRLVVSAESEGGLQPLEKFTKAVWDNDVAAVFNSRLPLDQLVAAAESTRLPARLRTRVAQSAYTRAVTLERPDAGRRAAAVLRTLAPALRDDLARYMDASTDDARHRAAVLTLLRTPGLSINVAGRDDDDSFDRDTPPRRFGHGFPSNWWCRVNDGPSDGSSTLAAGTAVPFPPFITDAGRAAADQERMALTTTEAPREYLIKEAIAWAQSRRADPEAAEALALAIEGWRWSPCSYDAPKSDLPRRAFTLLHRQFPDTEWAKRTKYWYD